ncbi:hypothetical protein [Sphingomonas lycopersici]|uniref:Uncharacterized protein n=1 Tax=Sphingomonas lycopersici TaxID=2951807 RepID=A0AA42CT05_9SPHN|nr:hypothetical protein [Sphingomonas lycopersici]MCW6533913.1 hypothetical protein [Sphingomonas lycopersici]
MSEDHGKGSFGRQEEGRLKLNHEIRNQWLDKDETLNTLWHKSGMTRDAFIEHNIQQIDKIIAERSGDTG